VYHRRPASGLATAATGLLHAFHGIVGTTCRGHRSSARRGSSPWHRSASRPGASYWPRRYAPHLHFLGVHATTHSFLTPRTGYAPLPHSYPGSSAPAVPLSAYYPSMDPLRMGSRPTDGMLTRKAELGCLFVAYNLFHPAEPSRTVVLNPSDDKKKS
jgi:hypothetical protein